jgi:type II secretory pathway component GspD/PulD (secretin)
VDILNEALAKSQFRLVRRTNSLTILADSEKLDISQVPIVRMDELPSQGRSEYARVVVSLKTLTPEEVVPQIKKLLGPQGDVFALADRLVLQDTVGNLRQILPTLKDLDDRAPIAKRPQAEQQFRKYVLPTASAESTLRVLQQFFQNSRTVRMSVAGNNTLLVWASPVDQEQIEAILQSVPQPAIEVVQLTTLQATRTIDTLKAMFKSAGGLYLEADPSGNAIIVRGNPEQIKEIKAALLQLGDAPNAAPARVITIQHGNAAALAEELQRLLGQMVSNPIQIIAPGQKAEPPKPKPDPKILGKSLPPLTLTVVGNKLVAACDDPQVLALIRELTRLVTKDGGAEFGDFQILRLRAAFAMDMAKLLQEAFNGPEFGPLGRARIVADPATNSLLVQASPLDMLSIKRLVNSLDIPHGETEAEIMNYIIALKHTKAEEIAKIIADVYQPKGTRPGRAGFSVGTDARTNTIVVRGTQAQIKEVKTLIDQLDVPK